MATQAARRPHVFINCPFDDGYEPLFVALVGGLIGLGLAPRSVLEVQGATDRLRRLYQLIRSCDVSVHDLSFIRLSRTRPRVPRFNMPFELGLAAAVGMAHRGHRWLVLERRPYRLQASLSDVNGYDPFIHHGTPNGVLTAVANAFSKPGEPSMKRLRAQHRAFTRAAADLKRRERHRTCFAPRAFRQLVLLGTRLAAEAS